MMTQNADKKREQIQMFCMDDLVPQDHLLRLIDQAIDWSFIYDLVIDKYSADNGRPSMDPVMLIKIPFIQYLYGIRSMRQTVKEIEVNVAYRWFLGLEMMDKVPHFSTFGFWSADPKRFVYSLRLPLRGSWHALARLKELVRPPNDGQTLFTEGCRHFRHAGACGFLRASAAQTDMDDLHALADKALQLLHEARILHRVAVLDAVGTAHERHQPKLLACVTLKGLAAVVKGVQTGTARADRIGIFAGDDCDSFHFVFLSLSRCPSSIFTISSQNCSASAVLCVMNR